MHNQTKLNNTITTQKNITYLIEDNFRYKINENENTQMKLWNNTMKKYQELANLKSEELKHTLLYNFIQHNTITIEREFCETHWNAFMLEENTFLETCKDILELDTNKQKNYMETCQ